jgi:PAS domain S-box-containing protein
MDYSELTREELIKIIELLNGRLEVHNQRLKNLNNDGFVKHEINNLDSYWKQIIDAIPVSVVLHDTVGYKWINKYTTILSGYTNDDWVNMSEQDRALIFEFPSKPETLVFLDMFTKEGKNPKTDSVNLEYKIKTKDGQWLWIFSTNSFIYNPQKDDFEVLSTAFDITDRKNHELEIEKLNQELNTVLERERKLAEEKQALMQQQIIDKNRELNRLAVFLTEKNNCLVKLKKQASELSNVSIKELKRAAKTIIKSIDDKLNSQSAWNTFEIQFETANPRFIQRLIDKFNDLSQMEIKICTLIKLDLSTKAISTILNVSPRTVDSHRYSIRKKMKLGQKEQLSLILNSI